jgi:hypothetical protein
VETLIVSLRRAVRMRPFQVLAVLNLLAATACNRDTAAPSATPPARVDVSLGVLVVDQPEMARRIGRLRGDWVDASGGDLRVLESSIEEFSKDSQVNADVVVYPARLLGQLVEAKEVRPLRQSVAGDESLAFSTIFPVVREGEIMYGGAHFAVPFGSRVPVISPRTGAGKDLSGRRFAAVWRLFARAAPLAEHPNQVAVLFDLETMDAWIAGPPFVRALEALTAPGTSAENWEFWPPLESSSSQRRASDEASLAMIPESGEIFDWGSGAWETPADGTSRVPLVGAESWIGSVTSASRNAPAAFRLLVWLASERRSGAGTVAIVPFRRGSADELTESALSARNYLQVPRILEVDEYLAALDFNIGHALRGELGPDEALHAAAKAWNEITDRVGRDRQRDAYRKHLNLQ